MLRVIKLKDKFIVLIIVTFLFGYIKCCAAMDLNIGLARTLTIKEKIAKVFIADPQIADYQIINSNHIVIYGKKMGSTNLIAYAKDGTQAISEKIRVYPNYQKILKVLAKYYPNLKLNLSSIADVTVVTGKVELLQDAIQIYNLVGQLLGLKAVNNESSGRKNFSKLINKIKVAHKNQVNVKLSILDVSHDFKDELGLNIGSIPDKNLTNIISGTTFTNLAAKGAMGLSISKITDIVAAVKAIADKSIGQVLAEPNLSVISGESASFLVGGEVPIVTETSQGTNVDYKEWGISLVISPKVENNNQITLVIKPEVSSIDTQVNNKWNIPAITTRKAKTIVQLRDGESFILGGLLTTQEQKKLSKIPFIGDIPILGALFKNTVKQQSKRELLIIATVYLVKHKTKNNVTNIVTNTHIAINTMRSIMDGFEI